MQNYRVQVAPNDRFFWGCWSVKAENADKGLFSRGRSLAPRRAPLKGLRRSGRGWSSRHQQRPHSSLSGSKPSVLVIHRPAGPGVMTVLPPSIMDHSRVYPSSCGAPRPESPQLRPHSNGSQSMLQYEFISSSFLFINPPSQVSISTGGNLAPPL